MKKFKYNYCCVTLINTFWKENFKNYKFKFVKLEENEEVSLLEECYKDFSDNESISNYKFLGLNIKRLSTHKLLIKGHAEWIEAILGILEIVILYSDPRFVGNETLNNRKTYIEDIKLLIFADKSILLEKNLSNFEPKFHQLYEIHETQIYYDFLIDHLDVSYHKIKKFNIHCIHCDLEEKNFNPELEIIITFINNTSYNPCETLQEYVFTL